MNEKELTDTMIKYMKEKKIISLLIDIMEDPICEYSIHIEKVKRKRE